MSEDIPKICYGCKSLKIIDHYGKSFTGDWCEHSCSTTVNDFYSEVTHYCSMHPQFDKPKNLFEALGDEANEELHKSSIKLKSERDEYRERARIYKDKFEAIKGALNG